MTAAEDPLAALVAACHAHESAMMTLLAELVAINSYSYHPTGGAEVAAVLARELGAIPDLEVRLRPSERFAPHVIASSRAARSSPRGAVALVGHLDTVFPPGTFEGFSVEDGLARGPGVVDMKGGLVVMIGALALLGRQGLLADLPLRLVIVSDEEIGSPEGAGVIAEELTGAACALVFEAGRAGDAIITSRKGTGSLELVAHGRAAHSGNAHERGVNAIWALAKLIDRVQRLTDYPRGVTVNVGTVSGGQGRNTVPDRASALCDLRFASAADGEALVTAAAALAREVEREIEGARIELVGGVKRPPLQRSDENVALYRAYAASARAAGLGDAEAGLIGGGSDAATTAALGIPSIDGLGPRGSGFHTRDECVEVQTFVPRLEALVRFVVGRRVG
jgi:glutamate carboxypeptidase